MKVRIRFGKHGVMKYIGHLDVMRYFQKAMRRARIPIKYSEGYHPHQIMSFAEPLGLGVTSDGEYMDIELKEPILSQEAIQRFNDTMVDGMVIYSFKELPDKTKNAMASVRAASYRLTYARGEAPASFEELQKAVREFYEDAASIPIIKETKKTTRELDLKPLIFQWNVLQDPLHVPEHPADPSDGECGDVGYEILLNTGSKDNIKPQLVMEHFHQFLHLNPEEWPIRIVRYDMYTDGENGLISLDDVGKDITNIEVSAPTQENETEA